MHQCLHRQLPSMHTCACVSVCIYTFFFRDEESSCSNRQQRTFWTPVIRVNSLGVGMHCFCRYMAPKGLVS